MQIICSKVLVFQLEETIKTEEGHTRAVITEQHRTKSVPEIKGAPLLPQEVPDWCASTDLFKLALKDGTVTVWEPGDAIARKLAS